jgi:GNAT superfamily N-acetyltransferase
MDDEYRILYTDTPEDSAHTIVGQGIRRFNEQQAGANGYQRLCAFVYAPDGTVVGGLIGATYWNWFYIDLLWVQDDLRGRGFGHRLLALGEEHARQRGAKGAYLDTFSFQAPDFYKRQGYEVFGELPDFPDGHQRYFFRKQL